jgi:hypothetical protein
VACAICQQEGFPESRCCFCGSPLSSRHEHDHFPRPARHGGDQVFPICLNCHDLKDRMDLRGVPRRSSPRSGA